MVLNNNQINVDTGILYESIIIDSENLTRSLNSCFDIQACANKEAANAVGCKKGVVSKPCHDCCDKDLCNKDKFNFTASGNQMINICIHEMYPIEIA